MITRRSFLARSGSGPARGLPDRHPARELPAGRFRLVYRDARRRAVRHPARRPPPDAAESARQTVAYAGSERPGTIVVDIDERFLYLVEPLAAGRSATASASAVRASPGWRRHGRPQGRLARTGRPTTMVSLKPDLPRYREGRARQPARRPRPLPLPERARHPLPHPRHQRALEHRRAGLVGLRAHAERGRGRPLQPRAGRHHRSTKRNGRYRV